MSEKNRHKNRVLIASLLTTSVIGTGTGIGVGYSIWHSQKKSENIRYYFITKDTMRGVYHNQYEFNDNFKADIENGESALTLYFFTNDDLLLLKFQTGTYVLTFETDSDETSKEMLDHFINRFKIEFAQYGNNRSNVQVSFIFNTDSTDYPCEEIGKCNLRIKVLDTNTNKIFFDFPQQFIFHAYVQLSRK